MDIEQERKKFEAWASGFGLRLKRSSIFKEVYAELSTQCAWKTWQAAVARCETSDIKVNLNLDDDDDETNEGAS